MDTFVYILRAALKGNLQKSLIFARKIIMKLYIETFGN